MPQAWGATSVNFAANRLEFCLMPSGVSVSEGDR